MVHFLLCVFCVDNFTKEGGMGAGQGRDIIHTYYYRSMNNNGKFILNKHNGKTHHHHHRTLLLSIQYATIIIILCCCQSPKLFIFLLTWRTGVYMFTIVSIVLQLF